MRNDVTIFRCIVNGKQHLIMYSDNYDHIYVDGEKTISANRFETVGEDMLYLFGQEVDWFVVPLYE